VIPPAPVADSAPAPTPEQTPTVTPDPAATPAATPTPIETPKSESGKLSVGLSATERTWVSLSSDGKTVFSGVLAASETKNIEGVENAKLTTGNAAGLDVRWNGKSIGP